MKTKIKLFEPENTPHHFHIGLRMIKTAVAVFLCSLVGYFRGQPAFFSMIAAVVCMQNSAGETLEIAFNQLFGTIIGAIFGLAILWVSNLTGMHQIMPIYYFVCSAILIPIIIVTLLVKKPSISAFACIVFLSITIFQLENVSPWNYALQRTTDILIGIVFAFIINIALPNKKRK